MPVNTDAADKINTCYEGLSQHIMEGISQNKKQIIIGDFNSHIRGWCHDGQTYVGGRQLLTL